MSIEVSLSLLRSRSQENSELRDSLAMISHDSFRINRILNNIGIIRSANQKQLSFNPVMLDLGEYMRKLADYVASFIPKPEIRVSCPKELKIYADPSLLESLLLNLISNCIIHAQDCSRISLSLTAGKERVFISVDDDGCGIAPEKLHSVFDRYSHNFGANDMAGGPGLGLSTARAIAAAHGGTLLLESRPGIGTAVRVSLSCNPFSKNTLTQPEAEYELTVKNLLTGLAGYLNAEYYTEKYMD